MSENGIFPDEVNIHEHNLAQRLLSEVLTALGLTDVDENGLAAIVAVLTAMKGTGWSNESLKSIKDAQALETTLTAIKGGSWSTETLKAIYDKIVSGGATESNLNTKVSDIEGTGFVKDTHSLKNLKDLIDAVNIALTFQDQADAMFNQVAEQNTWYTILDTTLNARIYAIQLKIATADETLEVRITSDGITRSGSAACTKDITYYVYLSGGTTNQNELTIGTSSYGAFRNMPLEARSVKVEVRKTTAAGANTLTGRVVYGKR